MVWQPLDEDDGPTTNGETVNQVLAEGRLRDMAAKGLASQLRNGRDVAETWAQEAVG